jgi:hypothetical protein
MADHNTAGAVSRRNVLKATGGLLAGSTMLAGLGAGRATAAEESIRVEVRELTEEHIAVDVRFPDDVFDGVEFPTDVFLGLAEQFVIHAEEDAVSLPEDTAGLANPVDAGRLDERTYRMYFRTEDVDWPEEDEEVTLGLGVFTERTIPDYRWDTCPGHRDY